MLEDGEATGAGGHEVEPLHDDEGDEVDGGGFVEDLWGLAAAMDVWGAWMRGAYLGHMVCVVRCGILAISKPEIPEGDALALRVPVCHGETTHAFLYAKEGVCVEEKLPINQLVFLRVSWSSQ